MDVGAARQAIATTLSVIPDVQVNPYVLVNPTPPGIQILPPGVDYDYSMGSLHEWTFMVQGFVALTTDVGTQKKLDSMCAQTGASSVKALLEANRTLGGLSDTLRVVSQSPGKQVDMVSGMPLLLVEWRVSVYAKGS